MSLDPPFPYYGSKRRVAAAVWQRLGDPGVYVEPFAGSLAVLLARPGGAGKREVVADTDGGLCNFWRAVTADPEGVAYWADWPTIHQDLTARHGWLRHWVTDHAHRLSADPDFYDAKAAGWWVWGMALWIGGGWCQPNAGDKRPHVKHHPGGGMGVSAQRLDLRDQIPHVLSFPGGGKGVAAQRIIRPALVEWFQRLQTRLDKVVVLNRGWESTITPSLLCHTATGNKPEVGILMDPPYLTDSRSPALYGSDLAGTSDQAAVESYRWAVENGDRFRIAYCAHEGDFPIPDGWDTHTNTFQGINTDRKHTRRDLIIFSPACKPPPQRVLF